jgi:hypothetical protein
MFTGGVRDSAELEISNLETDENRVRSIFVRFRTKVRPAPLRGSEGSRVTRGRAVFFKSPHNQELKMPSFGSKSKAALAKCHPLLQDIANEAIKEFDFMVLDATRGR